MNPRILSLGLLLFVISSASALGIIGATDAPYDSYEYIVLEEVLIVADRQFADMVSLDIKRFADVTDDEIRENIIIFVKDGRVIVSVPHGVQSVIMSYVETIESWIAPYLPYTRIDGDTIIDTGIDEQFTIKCFKSDSGIYEAGVTTGIMQGQSIPAVYEDLCVGNLLIEYACENDYVIRLEIPCDAGCSDGACIRPSGSESHDELEDYNATESDRRRGSGIECDTYWHWTRDGFICFRPEIPVEDVVIEPPTQCHGCISGERCMLFGERLPDNRTCTGIGFTCLGCETRDACIPNRATAPDGRVCIAGELKDIAPQPAPEPEPEPVREREPIEELFIPEPSESRGLFAIIADFFRNLFSRG